MPSSISAESNRSEPMVQQSTILQRINYSGQSNLGDQERQDLNSAHPDPNVNVGDTRVKLNKKTMSSTKAVVKEFVDLIRKECSEALKMVRHSLDRRELEFKLKILNERWGTIQGGLKSAIQNQNADIEAIHRAGCLEIEPIYRETSGQIQSRIAMIGNILVRDPIVDGTDNFKCTKFEYSAARSQIRNILNVSPTKCNDHKSLCDLVQVITGALDKLKETSLNIMELFIINAIEDKLDVVTRTEWSMKCENKAPTLKKLLEYLDKRSRVLTTLSGSPNFEHKSRFDQTLRSPSAQSTDQYGQISAQRNLDILDRSSNQQNHRVNPKPFFRSAKQTPYNSFHRQGQRGQPRFESNIVHRQFRPCVLCGGDHGLFKCGRFIHLPVIQRLYVVKNYRLCVNCLGPFHNLSHCRIPLVECPRCPLEYHNSVLCKSLHN